MSKAALIYWMERNRPDLDRALMMQETDDVRIALNKVTGLNVDSGDLIEDGCAMFLDALIRISKETPPGAVDNRAHIDSEKSPSQIEIEREG